MESPMVYDQVEFSWRIASDALNVLQRSYRIVVESAAGIVWWDTGEIISSRQSFVAYEGPVLPAGDVLSYTVMVHTTDGEQATASGTFYTGLGVDDWKAQWVESPFPRNPHQMLSDGIENPVLSFTRNFRIDRKFQ